MKLAESQEHGEKEAQGGWGQRPQIGRQAAAPEPRR